MIGEQKYILDEYHNIVPVIDWRTWATWYEKAERHVGLTEVGDATVSTVFLSLDHNLGYSDRPVLFETMVFGGTLDGE